jgi:hypothetical protein
MIRRRPAAVYEMLTEDELLERAEGWPEPDPPAAEPATRHHEPIPHAAPNAARPANSGARATLGVALGAVALVGFGVWELMGLAVQSTSSHAVVAPAREQGLASSTSRHIRRQPIRSSAQPRAVRPRRGHRARSEFRVSKVQLPPVRLPTRQTVSLALPVADPRSPQARPTPEIEFGFER